MEEQARLTAGAGIWSTPAIPEAGVPGLSLADGPMGVASQSIDERDVSLLMPCGTALAASWDTALAREVGTVVAAECRRRHVQAILGPNLNLPRSPLAGRAFETYSEEPLLSALIGAAWIAGVQGGGVSAVAKHLVANDSETQRHSMNSVVDQRALREVYLRPFEYAARAGVGGLLLAYNRMNGLPCVEHADLMGIVRNEWRWPGVLMSDWFGTHDGARSLNAGLDLEMPGPARHMGERAAALVGAGEVPARRVAEAADRLQTWARRWTDTAPGPAADAQDVLVRAAAAGFVLLSNDGLLPLDPAQSLAVIGPNASAPCYQGATFARIALADDVPTPVAALQGAFADVRHEPGVAPTYRLPPLTAQDITAPSGEPGLDVTYATAAGEEVFHEVRRTSTLVWFSDMPGGLHTAQPGRVRARTRLIPAVSGPWRLSYGGTGDVTFLIDGAVQGERPSPVVGGDVMGHLLRAESGHVDLELRAGVPVELDYRMTFGGARAQGLWFGARPPEAADLLERAVAAAGHAAQVALVVGETADSGVESRDRTTTRLPDDQLDLIRRVCAANPRTVVIVNAAHAVDLSWADHAAAVMQVWFPGQGFAPALADVLSGAREPGGRLPVTVARAEADYPAFDLTPDAHGDLPYGEGVLIGARAFAARGTVPAYPLGAGVGYAQFDYCSVAADAQTVTLNVRNTSGRAGKTVVQVYLEMPALDGVPAYPTLAAFQAVTLAAGEVRDVTLAVAHDAYRQWSQADGRWITQPGPRRVQVGRFLGDAVWEGTVTPPH
ncbi:glycosyl hydrolase [Deinococcus metalli]|uniref:Glycosyl hydrolase n=1 Tax=Deinococcus metalli TaxID=1141878 RepID=A0ABQ3JP66_9DEIO|nr:glycosyl hydrolase [Deinococcus metalli]